MSDGKLGNPALRDFVARNGVPNGVVMYVADSRDDRGKTGKRTMRALGAALALVMAGSVGVSELTDETPSDGRENIAVSGEAKMVAAGSAAGMSTNLGPDLEEKLETEFPGANFRVITADQALAGSMSNVPCMIVLPEGDGLSLADLAREVSRCTDPMRLNTQERNEDDSVTLKNDRALKELMGLYVHQANTDLAAEMAAVIASAGMDHKSAHTIRREMQEEARQSNEDPIAFEAARLVQLKMETGRLKIPGQDGAHWSLGKVVEAAHRLRDENKLTVKGFANAILQGVVVSEIGPDLVMSSNGLEGINLPLVHELRVSQGKAEGQFQGSLNDIDGLGELAKVSSYMIKEGGDQNLAIDAIQHSLLMAGRSVARAEFGSHAATRAAWLATFKLPHEKDAEEHNARVQEIAAGRYTAAQAAGLTLNTARGQGMDVTTAINQVGDYLKQASSFIEERELKQRTAGVGHLIRSAGFSEPSAGDLHRETIRLLKDIDQAMQGRPGSPILSGEARAVFTHMTIDVPASRKAPERSPERSSERSSVG